MLEQSPRMLTQRKRLEAGFGTREAPIQHKAPTRAPAETSARVVQRVIVAPPAEQMDLIIALAIFQMLVNKIDDKVVPLNRLGEVDLSGEAIVHVQGHGSGGSYEGTDPLDLIRALESAQITFGPSVQLLLDYCYSADGFSAFETKLKDTGTSVRGNAGPAVTQDDGQHHSKPKIGSLNEETQQKFKEQCDKIVASSEWSDALKINAELVAEIAALKTIDPPLVAALIQARIGEAYKLVGEEYKKLYRLNEELIAQAARQQIRT